MNSVGKNQKGFTIVELLIVIVVIAILAAITIVAYNGIQNRANDTSVQSDLVSAMKKIEAARIDDPGNLYPASSAGMLNSAGVKFSTSAFSTAVNNALYCRSFDGKDAGIAAMSKGGTAYYISGTSGGLKPYALAWSGSSAATCTNFVANTGVYGVIWGYTNNAWAYGV